MRTKYWFLGASALLAAAPSPAMAAYCYFQGNDGGSWSTAGNWGCGKLPVAGDDVVLATERGHRDGHRGKAPFRKVLDGRPRVEP